MTRRSLYDTYVSMDMRVRIAADSREDADAIVDSIHFGEQILNDLPHEWQEPLEGAEWWIEGRIYSSTTRPIKTGEVSTFRAIKFGASGAGPDAKEVAARLVEAYGGKWRVFKERG